mmetsp:Transcript_48370/g.126473  ORF Transcript_48370/g.126473 Transcript_48370/m.126473 type:complete len:295 (-) Transcript_48370:73-957(-)
MRVAKATDPIYIEYVHAVQRKVGKVDPRLSRRVLGQVGRLGSRKLLIRDNFEGAKESCPRAGHLIGAVHVRSANRQRGTRVALEIYHVAFEGGQEQQWPASRGCLIGKVCNRSIRPAGVDLLRACSDLCLHSYQRPKNTVPDHLACAAANLFTSESRPGHAVSPAQVNLNMVVIVSVIMQIARLAVPPCVNERYGTMIRSNDCIVLVAGIQLPGEAHGGSWHRCTTSIAPGELAAQDDHIIAAPPIGIELRLRVTSTPVVIRVCGAVGNVSDDHVRPASDWRCHAASEAHCNVC